MFGIIYTLLKMLRFDVVYRNTKIFLPEPITNWVSTNSEKYKEPPLVSVKALQPKFKKACEILTDKIGANNIGDYLEFGVYNGTSMNCMFQTLKELKLNDVRVFGFDSFEGLPAVAAIDTENELQPGDYASNITFTSKRLTNYGIDWNRTFLVKGWFEDTLNESLLSDHAIQKASIIMIDCDLYSSAKRALNFCAPLIKDTSIIFIDDWSEEAEVGERRAFHEFLQENPYLKSEFLDHYKHKGRPNGRIFIVSDRRA